MKNIYLQIDEEIRKANTIGVISHMSPDGDAIGSTTALYEILDFNFPSKKINVINLDDVPGNLVFLPNAEKITKDFSINDFDLIITVDIGAFKLNGFGEDKEIVFKDKMLINIDHHLTNEFYGNINLVDISKPSTTSVLYDFFVAMEYKINKNAALCLLTGIYTDTGSFIYSNVTPDTFTISSELMNIGGDPTIINDEFFSNNSFEFLKLYSIVLDRFTLKDNVGISYIKKEDLEECNCIHNELGIVVSKLNQVEGIDYVCFLSEKGNMVKGSLRTYKEDVDLTKIAKRYNGGGHKKASAFTIEGKIKIEDGKIAVEKTNGEIIYFT
ncbi:MAG: bifunctional oligoribonuclease/PAP phosphatase NrnA [Candidatus Gracilibacteria bacterium]|nr:bifunctional oligoribonuclease/PAP phosphatase NrnA [Candidatus Gracilibacteria bacterium]